MGTSRPTRRLILRAGLSVPASLVLGRISIAAPASADPRLTFPGEARNERDSLFRPQLLVSLADVRDGESARFDFVLALG